MVKKRAHIEIGRLKFDRVVLFAIFIQWENLKNQIKAKFTVILDSYLSKANKGEHEK